MSRGLSTPTAVLVVFALGGLGVLAPLSRAQEKEKFVQAQKQNSAALRQYTWKSRTELKLKGESKSVKLDQVRYDLDGKLQKTPIGGTPEKEQPAPAPAQGRRGRGRVKEKVIENKKEEFAELMQNLAQLVASYGHLPQDKLQAFAQKATLTPGEGALAGTLRIQGADVLQPGDSMAIWIDRETQMMRRVEIETALDKKPVKVQSEFQSVTGGPTYQARSVVNYPEKEIELIVENYDYQRLGS